MSAPDVAALLAELERSEPDLADEARTAVEWLTGGEPLETVTQLDVCEFLWYTLPLKVGGDHERLARSLGRLLKLGGLERYAALCVSPTTARILRTYARDGEDAGTRAYHHALEETGVLPPDVPELQWSMIMGPEELGAHVACSAALELSILAGENVDRVALTRRWLTEPRADLGGDSWLHRVQGERLNRWVLGRGPARRKLAQPFEVRLHAPVAPQPLPALHRLLSVAAAEGTLPFRLAPSPEALRLRELAEHELGALSRDGSRLTVTGFGRKLLASPELMWDAVTRLLLARGDEFELSVREAALMLLADGVLMSPAELREKVAEVVGGEGWHAASGPEDVAAALARLIDQLAALDLAFADPLAVRLTWAGRFAALAALRAHALRPRKYVNAA
ncbi:hypothetical protein OUY22_00955 [Nonomuraea sp. MCN248]|uniref:Helicase XPB/Ssl2 N-terminal domain-containing protein n=1 Tax=Nonomuraea corallina TaxID=2989783 RepID=A0ABT4S461_9ACTN|nr:hypothetical protein [Nonomuraea corallina]MDA0631969.1 hypothetical protein [Nonomuraea corallina]